MRAHNSRVSAQRLAEMLRYEGATESAAIYAESFDKRAALAIMALTAAQVAPLVFQDFAALLNSRSEKLGSGL